jgi:predicted O-linked N-acetylglucosamine transferase (SPINDLY family)
MGTQAIDYLIADSILIPKNSRSYYSEKIIYLPNCYQANDTKRKISDEIFTREQLGLPAKEFIFCCFNNNWKITPETFDLWAQILRLVDNSILWLFEDNSLAASNIRTEAKNRGLHPDRIVFAKFMNHASHLARYKAADLFLDTFPYNAHTTASDALWAGTPVLTLEGKSFSGRVAASLLTNVRLPELITQSTDEYVSRAIELANNRQKLISIKRVLHENRSTSPLFNILRFVKDIESSYQKIYHRYHSGLPPDHIYFEA